MNPISFETDSQVPAPLARGTVRAGHIVFLFAIIYATTAIVAFKITRSTDPEFQFALRNLIGHVGVMVLLLVLTFAVPELRRSIPILYAPARTPVLKQDALLMLVVMLTWAYGAHRILVHYPLLRWHPALFDALGYAEHLHQLTPTYVLLWSLTVGIAGPIGEELLFRGYLQNLWQLRWGVWPGVFASAIVFAAVHLQNWTFALFGGFVYSLAYLKYRSLVPGTLLHGLYNLSAVPHLLGPFFFEKSKADVANISHWIPELALTAAFFPLLYLFWRRFRPQT